MVARRDLTQATVPLGRSRTGLAGLADTAVSVREWPARRWLGAVGAAVVFAVAAGVPTDVLPNPLAHRRCPPPGGTIRRWR
jgi:hypothetical protein